MPFGPWVSEETTGVEDPFGDMVLKTLDFSVKMSPDGPENWRKNWER